MEEGLLASSKVETVQADKLKEESPQGNVSSSDSVTPVVVLGTVVALCGSLSAGCSVSNITLSVSLLLTNFLFKTIFIFHFLIMLYTHKFY